MEDAELEEAMAACPSLVYHSGCDWRVWLQQFDAGRDRSCALLLARELKIIGLQDFR